MAADRLDESQRWVPSFSLYFDLLGQKLEGSLETGPVLGPPLSLGGCLDNSGNRTGQLCASARQNKEQILFPNDDGSDTSVVPLVGASIELMTPRLSDSWLQPRLFVHGDGAAAFAFKRAVAGRESPDAFALPSPIIIIEGTDPEAQLLEELSIVGQGSRTQMKVRDSVWSAGAGIAFRFDWFGRRVRVKPSFEYLHQELDLIGIVHRAVKLKEPLTSVVDLKDFRQLALSRREKQEYHGIGPGLEVEIDTSRLGPFGTSVFLMGRAYHLIGDLETTLSASQDFVDSDSGETVTERASWTFQPQPWVWRGGVGFRVRWLPED